MVHKTALPVVIALVLIAFAAPLLAPAHAQEGSVSTTYQLNLRAGAGTTFAIVATLPAGTPVVLEARNGDTSWVLGHTADGASRGWMASLYLTYPPGLSATGLPLSEEVLNAPGPGPAPEPAAGGEPQPAAAPAGGVGAFTNYQMNVRSGPGTTHSALGQLPAGVGLILEARNADTSWVLVHTEDNALRGWVASLYLRFSISAGSLPVSAEIIVQAAAGPAAPDTGVSLVGINLAGYNPDLVVGIDLAAFPVVGRATGNARAIFVNGRAQGNNPHVVAKVGDCSSEHWYFLKSFAWGEYNLGAYTDLQAVIDHFGESFGYDSQADHNGFNSNAVISPEWGNPAVCQKGESPLECEFRLHKPSVAIIMFGTSDLLFMSPAEFNKFIRLSVEESIEAGVIPVLSTFPGNLNFWDRTILYNQIVVRVALDYDIPLINLWLALESLPNHGLEADGFHLGESPYGTAGVLTDPYLQYGYPMRNLVTLQTLDAVWRGAMY